MEEMDQMQLMTIIIACEEGGNRELLKKAKKALIAKEKGEEKCLQPAQSGDAASVEI